MKANSTSLRRQHSTRKKTRGIPGVFRISIFRSNKYLSAQIIDDSKRVTVLGINEKNMKDIIKGSKTEKAKALGLALAKEAIGKKISKVVFDRGRYAYHGRVKAFAESLREGGLKF